MKISTLFLIALVLISAGGCSKKDNPVTPPSPSDSTSVTYQIDFSGMKTLRQGEFYILWLKVAPDTSWRIASVLTIDPASSIDTSFIFGKFQLLARLDSITDVLISLEKTSAPASIGLPIARSGILKFDASKKNISASLDAFSFLGDFSLLQGGLVFTSTSTDTLTYTREFYLMNIEGAKQNASLQSLKLPPPGWKYGLWAEDLQFMPHQYFLYGLFSMPAGHDDDSINDFYPFPGGRKPQRMDMSSGSIIVTLEPDFYSDSLKFKTPSPFTLLQFNRIRFIDKDRNYPMSNVSMGNIPRGGTILLRRN